MAIPSLARRSSEPEHLDDPFIPAFELTRHYRQIRRLNRLFFFARPFQVFLPGLVGAERCRELTLLDVGAGTAELGRALTAWAARRGWRWRVTSMDFNQRALDMGHGYQRVVGSALALPFGDEAFDCVIASQMTHHLATEHAIVQHFREAWRVSRIAVLFSDLHRQPSVYRMVWWATLLMGCSKQLRADGITSVARGFRIPEWEALSREAGIPGGKTTTYCGARVLLQARKRA